MTGYKKMLDGGRMIGTQYRRLYPEGTAPTLAARTPDAERGIGVSGPTTGPSVLMSRGMGAALWSADNTRASFFAARQRLNPRRCAVPQSKPTAQNPRPSTIRLVRDELNYHGRLLALAACMEATLSAENLVVLAAALLKASDRLAESIKGVN